jgi:hypothetical protein
MPAAPGPDGEAAAAPAIEAAFRQWLDLALTCRLVP